MLGRPASSIKVGDMRHSCAITQILSIGVATRLEIRS
jgi:hypothetical protein